MARRSLLIAALIAGACALLPDALAQISGGEFNVKINVEGTVLIYVSHASPARNTTAPIRTPLPELVYTLVDNEPTEEASMTTMRVDFGRRASTLVTGDYVQTAITIRLTTDQLAQIGMGGGSGRRRLLSERHEAARRMVLDFHGTRRTLQEVSTLTSLLKTLGVTAVNQVPRSDNLVVVGKNPAKDMFVINGQPQEFTSLTFVVRSSSCGLKTTYTTDTVRNQWYDNGDSAPVVATLQRYYNVCSFGQINFKRENNPVFELDIPCVGNISRGTYNLKNGSGNGANLENELWGLPEVARNWLRVNNPTVASKWGSYRRKIFIFPFNWFANIAGFAGLAMMGCAENQDCYTWINPYPTDTRMDLPVVFQELGHNIGLAHSSARRCSANGVCDRDEYGDFTDPMGYTFADNVDKGVVCFNAPQSFKAGWASPIAGGHISAVSDLVPGIPRDFTLPPAALTKKNMLRIVTDATNNSTNTVRSPQRALFVSYRVKQSNVGVYDSGLRTSGRVWIHEYNDTANGVPTNINTPPVLISNLSLALRNDIKFFVQTLPGVVGGLNVSIKAASSQNATVSVCRFLRRTEDNCQDGIDNDCDGVTDMDDLDCNPSLRPSPPSPLRPSSPPPPPRRPPPLRFFEIRRPPSPRPPPHVPRSPRVPRVPRPPRAPRPPRPAQK